jgi:hypothetical protein
MAISATNDSAANLVQLDVRENNGGTSLIISNVAWNSFAADNQSQDFQLTFTNTIAGDPLEFRVYWNQVAGAPTLTVNDITIDGSHNWTAANLAHDIGRLDGLNSWEADPVRNTASGYLSKGSGTMELPAGDYSANFELKVDNFNWDNMIVAELSVVNDDTGDTIISRDLTRREFTNALYQNFPLNFSAAAGAHYDFRVYWYYAPDAPRLTQMFVVVAQKIFNIQNLSNKQVQLNWSDGTLQSSTDAAGPYSDITDAISPYAIMTTNARQFFRVRER